KNSSLETKKLETDRKYTSSAYSEKDFEIRRIRRESDLLRERISTLESEKRRIERSYANLEKEYSAATRNTVRHGSAALPHQHHRTSSPANTEHRSQSDQSSSMLSISRLLADTTFLNSTTGANSKLNFSKVTRGIEALEQQHMEIQQKVLGLE